MFTTLRSQITLAVVSALALVLGIVLMPIVTIPATVIITIAVLALAWSMLRLVPVAIAAISARRAAAEVEPFDWTAVFKWVFRGIAIAILIALIIIIILLCRGCNSSVSKGTISDPIEQIVVDKLIANSVETPQVSAENITATDLETETITADEAVVENQTVSTETVETQNVDNATVETQEVVEQTVEEQYVYHETVVEQTVTEATVEKQEVKEQSVEEQVVEKQEIVVQQSQPEITPAPQPVPQPEAKPQPESQPEVKPQPAPVHTHEYVTDQVQATCETQGSVVETCSCGDTKSQVLPALGHKIVDAKEVPATCVNEGYVEYLCSCGKVMKTQSLKAKGHEWDNGKTTVTPTYTKSGKKLFTCKACGETKTDVLEALECDHDYSWEELEEATCESKGSEAYTCKECGDVLRTRETEKLGHDYEVVSEKKATATKDGYVKYRCNNCGDTYQDTIPATGEVEEPEINSNIVLKSSRSYLPVGEVVTITTTGNTSDLQMSYDPSAFEVNIVDEHKVTVKFLGSDNGVPVTAMFFVCDSYAENDESWLELEARA